MVRAVMVVVMVVMVVFLLADAMVHGLFLQPQDAHRFLGRARRANDKGLLKLEERRQGDLERECVEELCSHEEAREVFENIPETEYFYPRYQDCVRRFGTPSKADDEARRAFKICVRGLPNQCSPMPCKVGSHSQCVDLQGDFQCVCLSGWTGKTCSEVWSECAERRCEQGCSTNPSSSSSPGGGETGTRGQGVRCHCEGRNATRLGPDGRSCVPIESCSPLSERKEPRYFYLGANAHSGPALFMRFNLKKLTRPMSTFELRTFDPEGLLFYGETGDHSRWFLLALHNGQLEVQMKDPHGRLVTTGGRRANDGVWHQVSVEKTSTHVVVKLDNEEVINANNPGAISSGTEPGAELAISVGGLPPSAPDILRPMNVRVDGCIRNWDWMNQDTSWITSVTQADPDKQCYSHIEPGSYFPGNGFVRLPGLSYGERKAGDDEGDEWRLQMEFEFRTAREPAVLIALVSKNGSEAELTLALTDGGGAGQGRTGAGIGVFLGAELILHLEPTAAPPAGPSRATDPGLCDGVWHSVALAVSPTALVLQLDRVRLNKEGWADGSGPPGRGRGARLMPGAVHAYVGGIPDSLSLTAAPVSAHYRGCVRGLRVGGRPLDLHDADVTQGPVRAHSCLPLAQSPV